jgi:predicted metal-dependent peptidase
MTLKTHSYPIHTPTHEQAAAMEIARIGFMSACPFYAHYFYGEMVEVPTLGVSTAATDGRHIFINPEYLMTLKPSERVFVYAHEVDHQICRDPERMHTYSREGMVRGVEFDQKTMNRAQDYVRNAGLMEQGVGLMNPAWCYDKRFGADDLPEDVYKSIYTKPPEGGDNGGSPGINPGGRAGSQGAVSKGAKRDAQADANDGGFDEVLPPPVDPVTGKVDLPDDATFREAVARAAAAAKAMGNMPEGLMRRVNEILDPQVDWRDHIRMQMMGIFGSRGETWKKLDRRSVAMFGLAIDLPDNPFMIRPGRKGYGADCVVVARDTSGSMSTAEEAAAIAEIGGILADVRPRRVIVIDCDARVAQVQELETFEDATDERMQRTLGHGGTSFIPPFEYLEEHNIRPECLVYCTDMQGPFPADPGYPTIWCATTDAVAPFGETIRIKI